MILFIALVAINVGAWCWLAATAATQPDVDFQSFESRRPLSFHR